MTISLAVGLGNPGARYEATRHNAGFWFVDALARAQGLRWRTESRFQGEICKLEHSGGATWLLKPTTYMNLSGQSVAALASYYKIPLAGILVAHDELDLAPGTARLKQGGGHAGHNGLRSMIETLGNADFLRLRLGIGRPAVREEVIDYVLERPSRDDESAIGQAIDAALAAWPDLLRGELQRAMHRLHSQ